MTAAHGSVFVCGLDVLFSHGLINPALPAVVKLLTLD